MFKQITLCWFLSFLLAYLLGAFYAVSFDVNNWTLDTRFFMEFLALVFAVFSTCFYYLGIRGLK